MKREKWIAEALTAWLDEALRTESDVAREGLPPMDVRHFLTCLAQAESFRAEDFSLALAGFEVDETGLRALANKVGLRQLAHVAVDLNTAAAWRNAHQQHPRIIALARGRHGGGPASIHFKTQASRRYRASHGYDLSRSIGNDASDQCRQAWVGLPTDRLSIWTPSPWGTVMSPLRCDACGTTILWVKHPAPSPAPRSDRFILTSWPARGHH